MMGGFFFRFLPYLAPTGTSMRLLLSNFDGFGINIVGFLVKRVRVLFF